MNTQHQTPRHGPRRVFTWGLVAMLFATSPLYAGASANDVLRDMPPRAIDDHMPGSELDRHRPRLPGWPTPPQRPDRDRDDAHDKSPEKQIPRLPGPRR